MNNHPLISVIVPIYNVADYLEECIRSITGQTYPHLEIILVDDGSTDRCGQICDRFAEHDSRIQVVHQPNRGLSAARNAGLERANGSFISFIDSDDYLDARFHETLLQPLLKHPDIGITACQSYKVEKGKTAPMPSAYSISLPTLLSYRDCCEKAILSQINVCVWNKLYRAHLLKEVQFREGRIVEDVLFMADLSEVVKKHRANLYILPERLYFYRIRPGSISHNEEPLLIEALRCRKEILEKFRATDPAFCQQLEEMIHMEILFLNGMLERNPVWKKKYASTYRPMLRDIPVHEIWTYKRPFRTKMSLFVIRICPALYPHLRRIKQAVFRH